jgi:hypothetical protein
MEKAVEELSEAHNEGEPFTSDTPPIVRSAGSRTMMNEARRRALDVLSLNHPLETQLFALYMWPMSSSWRCPAPGRVGRGICLKAGSFLSCLVRDGLAELRRNETGQSLGYVLTQEGHRVSTATKVRQE